jgi:CRISPR system Cascade subunit CasC
MSSQFLQLHLLTFYPPSNLNRDDLGRPKTASIGGANRLRISSQALKRAWRTSSPFAAALSGHLGSRTQRLGELVVEHLTSRNISREKAIEVAINVATAFGKPEDGKDKNPVLTKQLAFISPEEQESALSLADRIAAGEKFNPEKQAGEVLRRTDTAADIAMFGRMLADNPDFNREAAVQVAHAFTTHKVAIEDDYYTAVDDLKRSAEDAGAGFLGEAGFGAGVFYLYLCVDRGLLVRNLGGDKHLAGIASAALVEAAATIAPGGKQASFASRARAQYVLAEMGDQQPRTLAAAFLQPVEADDFMVSSIARLEQSRASMDKVYSPCWDRQAALNAVTGTGSMAEIKFFCGNFD